MYSIALALAINRSFMLDSPDCGLSLTDYTPVWLALYGADFRAQWEAARLGLSS